MMNASSGYQNPFYFFLFGFPFKNIHESQDSKERRLFFMLLSNTVTRFANLSVFSVCSYRRGLMMKEDVASGSRNRITYFLLSKPL